MNSKFLKNLPIILSLIALLLTIPLLIWGVSQKQELRKKAAEPETFPNIDLNGDGVVNSIDYRIYWEKFSSPKP